ncbi:MAG: DUF1893 domain-containing protein [Ruminococcus sp.]|nr:DUF1893 domain-containing protein [Ruminococcus sp.]
MTDLEIAKNNLAGHSICLCRDGSVIVDDGRGISPMIRFIAEGRDLTGYSAADLIVGKAAAMLFVKTGICKAYGKVMSAAARDHLEKHGIACEWETLTPQIINRAGTGMCPMEQTVADINDTEAGYKALCRKLAEMQSNQNNG